MRHSTVKLTFTEDQIQALFGHEAAEDEVPNGLVEYYIKSSTYDQVVTSLPLRILVGHKGIGKSALFQVAIAEDREARRLALVVQPDDVIEIGRQTADFLLTIRNWKTGLVNLLAAKAIAYMGISDERSREGLASYGGRLIEFLKSILASHIEDMDLEPNKRLIARHFIHTPEISVYIDDLDRGWQEPHEDITRISALLNAIRDIARENRGIHFESLSARMYISW